MSKRHRRMKEKSKMQEQKRCPKCDTEKDITEFGRDASRIDGRYTYCKKCRKNPNRKDKEVLELAEKGLKRCTLCNTVKPFSAFDSDRSKSLGVTSRCKKCHRSARKERASEHHAHKDFIRSLEESGKTQCTRCKEIKSLERFLKHRAYATGYSRLCLSCNNETRATYRLHRKRSKRDYTRWEVFEDDNFTCYICEDVLSPDTVPNHPKSLSIDHVVPICKGGLDERDNVRTACLDCNRRKNDMSLEEFLIKVGVA